MRMQAAKEGLQPLRSIIKINSVIQSEEQKRRCGDLETGRQGRRGNCIYHADAVDSTVRECSQPTHTSPSLKNAALLQENAGRLREGRAKLPDERVASETVRVSVHS